MKQKKHWGLACLLSILCSCGQQHTAGTQPDQTVSSTIQQNPVVETIMARRSIRKYKNQPIESEKMQEIIRCGINAPNGKYLESWEVRIVDTPELMEEIQVGYNAYLEKQGRKSGVHPSYGAPVLIFIAYDPTYDLSQVDCGLLGGNMILSAESLGLGTCCLGGLVRYINSPEGAPLLKRLDFPTSHRLLYAISLGYPDEHPAAKPRNAEKVKFVK